ncbi:MAG TPA: hypothetical protein VFR66_00350 [Burkholderiales bacterium]|nr:hypothetical protein [Burkholderiales bacterium]
MTLSEPMTLATDYLLGGVTAWLCIRLARNAQSQKSRIFWALAFAAVALAAVLGGTWHGFVQGKLLWKATLLAAGGASFAMLAGSAFAVLSGTPRAVLLALASVKFLLYAAVVLVRDEFIFVVIDSGIALMLVAALHVWRLNAWIVAGVAVSVLGALVQASGLALHRHFNHNDLYHLIQVAAMFLLYRGALRLTDSVASGRRELVA